MGYDAGFDMVPRLSEGATDKKNWQTFIEAIKEFYYDDELIEIKTNFLEFNAGEHPKLPFEGHKLLRFSSKISGRLTKGVERYINTVTRLARVHFGSRIQYWNEAYDNWGFYDWQEVIDSHNAYEKAGVPIEINFHAPIINSTDDLDLLPFGIQEVPRKGKGLVARFNISKGTRVICEKPLFTVQKLSPTSSLESIIAKELKMLSKTEQRQFLLLHNSSPDNHPFSGIFKTNALPCGPGSSIGGVYPTICLINHSCLPNSYHSWNSNTNSETIHAVRDILAGEEITISYDKGGPSISRRTHLREGFGFDCSCEICSLSLPELQASDARRVQIQHLDDTIGDPARVFSKPDACLADCRSLLQVLEEEFIGGTSVASVARLYYDAFQISITHSDQARASIFARRAYEFRVICEGEDNPVTQKMKHLMEKPTEHFNFGVSKRWKTVKGLIPKGLDPEGFERWLWREGK